MERWAYVKNSAPVQKIYHLGRKKNSHEAQELVTSQHTLRIKGTCNGFSMGCNAKTYTIYHCLEQQLIIVEQISY